MRTLGVKINLIDTDHTESNYVTQYSLESTFPIPDVSIVTTDKHVIYHINT